MFGQACEWGTSQSPHAPRTMQLFLIKNFVYRRTSPVKGKRATWRERFIARESWRWCFAHVPVCRRGLILPSSVIKRRKASACL
jgi:hypothetical protein